MKIINVVGARPNLMKMAPIVAALAKYPDLFTQLLVHTGQHYDERMSRLFFRAGHAAPRLDLEVGSGSHGEQTGRIMAGFEEVCLSERPDLVIVVGDVNSTMACTITAKKLGIQVAHVEAGLRSRDISMPEEINRLCTDVLCDYLFTTDRFADENLRQEGIAEERIHFVGNVMIDTLAEAPCSGSEPRSDAAPWVGEGPLRHTDIAPALERRRSGLAARILEALREYLGRASNRFPYPSAHAEDG